MAAKVIATTDGGCDPNPGVMGWGVVLRYGEHVKELFGGESYGTNNQAEIIAAIEALRALKTACDVEVISDSQYLVNTMSKGWKRSKNLDLWQQLDEAAKPHRVTWTWVRGHNGHTDNERAHQLAERGIREARRRDADK
jgi:ribonuclease HI